MLYFYNTIIYKFDDAELEERFRGGDVTIDADSLARIEVGDKSLIIESFGLRPDLSATNIAQVAASRRLDTYKFGAEILKAEVNFKTGVTVRMSAKLLV